MALRYSYNPETGEWGLDANGKFRTPQEIAYALDLGHAKKGAQTNEIRYGKDNMGNVHYNQESGSAKIPKPPREEKKTDLKKYGFKEPAEPTKPMEHGDPIPGFLNLLVFIFAVLVLVGLGLGVLWTNF
jgi:hypothetical protein